MVNLILAPALVAILRRIALVSVILVSPAWGHELPLDQLKLPSGFSINVFAEVINPRQMARSPEGVIFTGSRRSGNIYAVIDADKDHVAETVITIDDGLSMPSGIAYRDGDLYVGAVNRILVYRDIINNLTDSPDPEVLYDSLPKEQHHGWKYLAFGPDGALYLNVGAPCNICLEDDPRFASIMRMDVDQRPLVPEVYASGVRNSVGFTWHPETEALWFTDNGRDYLGDDAPPCELNHAPTPGMHFGYPFLHGTDITDPEFGEDTPSLTFQSPVVNLGAHVAPLGLTFYEGDQFPSTFKQRILIAEHGSWNRSPEAGHVGYRVTMVTDQGDGNFSYEPFIDGWLQGTVGWGRPVDLLTLPDGSLLISDDTGNVIYRVTYDEGSR